MSHWIFLSWELHDNTPLYPGTRPVEIRPDRQIAAGDSCNTATLLTSNHAGTHLDTPRHFVADGQTLSDYAADDFVFSYPCLIDCPQAPGGIIGSEELAKKPIMATSDILLIRTGFQQYRTTQPEIYSQQGPCLSPEAALWLRSTFPAIRALGIDCISISSPLHREMGRAAHRALLEQRSDSGAPLLIIEDLRLPDDAGSLSELIVLPLRLQASDGAPCTVIGRYGDA